MSYGSAAALQEAVFARLSADAAVSAAVGQAIYDAIPGGTLPPLYLSLGVETAQARGDGGGSLTRHRLTVSVLADSAGFASAKALAAAVCDAVEDAPLGLARGRLLSLRLERAQAKRTAKNAKRRIDLRFAALIDD